MQALSTLSAPRWHSGAAHARCVRARVAPGRMADGMLERWVGNSLMPGVHGAAQPDILEGLPAMQAAWEAMRDAFQRECALAGSRRGAVARSVADARGLAWPCRKAGGGMPLHGPAIA